MGRRGPPPKPRIFAEADGNRGKRRMNDAEPMPERGAPGMPDWLSREAKAEWRRIAPELDRLGVLCKVDRAALAAYCQAFAELADASRMLEKEGRIIDVDVFNRVGDVTGSVRKLHPAVKLQRDAFGRVKQFLGEFGLTPSSRTRIRGLPNQDAAVDPAEEFFGGKKGRQA